MTEAIKVYPEKIVNQMKALHNSLEYTLQAEELEREKGHEPVMARNDEEGKIHIIVAGRQERAIWKGFGWGTARELQQEGRQQEVADITKWYR